ESGLPDPPAGVSQVLCAAFFPFAITVDGTESTRLEVRLIGSGISEVSLGNAFPIVGLSVDDVVFPQTGGFIDLFDDGTRGDRVAGDGIWTRDGIRVSAPPLPPIRSSFFDRMRYTNGSGTQTISIQAGGNNGQYGPARLGLLDPSLRAVPERIEDDLYMTDNVAFLVQPDTLAELLWLIGARPPTADILSVGQRVYEKFPDVFDFLILNPAADRRGGIRGALLSAQNTVEGIGRPIFDATADWGSAGNLQAAFALGLTDSGPVLHEIGHQWGFFVGDTLGFQQCAPVHVGIAGTGCGPLGGFEPESLIDNGDGTYSVSNFCTSAGGAGADTNSYNPLNLYLMGLIPASEVPPIPVPINVDCFSFVQDFVNDNFTFAADGIETVTIEDLIAEHGVRAPNVAGSPKSFTLGWIVPTNRVLNPTETGWFQYRSEYIGRQEVGDQDARRTFWEATGGRATLNTNIRALVDDLFEDRFQAAGAGTD
ncbi:MAG: hypothetical protein V2J10_03215, partial [Wenzhouxiangella sp.]|nr:hypothetical protein [Wenzhouxiangella sp.]